MGCDDPLVAERHAGWRGHPHDDRLIWVRREWPQPREFRPLGGLVVGQQAAHIGRRIRIHLERTLQVVRRVYLGIEGEDRPGRRGDRQLQIRVVQPGDRHSQVGETDFSGSHALVQELRHVIRADRLPPLQPAEYASHSDSQDDASGKKRPLCRSKESQVHLNALGSSGRGIPAQAHGATRTN